jgi:hypothetical protein
MPLIVAVAFDLNLASAHAGPCTDQIVSLERLVQRSVTGITVGLAKRQWVDAQLHHQPTARSIGSARKKADAALDAALARAKAFDADGNRAACVDAVAELKRLLTMYWVHRNAPALLTLSIFHC